MSSEPVVVASFASARNGLLGAQAWGVACAGGGGGGGGGGNGVWPESPPPPQAASVVARATAANKPARRPGTRACARRSGAVGSVRGTSARLSVGQSKFGP